MDKLLLLEILSNDPNFVFRLARVSESAFVVIEISYISLQCRNYCFAEQTIGGAQCFFGNISQSKSPIFITYKNLIDKKAEDNKNKWKTFNNQFLRVNVLLKTMMPSDISIRTQNQFFTIGAKDGAENAYSSPY